MEKHKTDNEENFRIMNVTLEDKEKKIIELDKEMATNIEKLENQKTRFEKKIKQINIKNMKKHQQHQQQKEKEISELKKKHESKLANSNSSYISSN